MTNFVQILWDTATFLGQSLQRRHLRLFFGYSIETYWNDMIFKMIQKNKSSGTPAKATHIWDSVRYLKRMNRGGRHPSRRHICLAGRHAHVQSVWIWCWLMLCLCQSSLFIPNVWLRLFLYTEFLMSACVAFLWRFMLSGGPWGPNSHWTCLQWACVGFMLVPSWAAHGGELDSWTYLLVCQCWAHAGIEVCPLRFNIC